MNISEKHILSDCRVLITGGHGFIGKHLIPRLQKAGVPEGDICAPRSGECDFRDRKNIESMMQGKDIVFHLAANVGGLEYNDKFQADIFYDNCIMSLNTIDAAARMGVKKIVCIGSVRMYSPTVSIPFKEEDALYDIPLHNASYAHAKRAMLSHLYFCKEQYGMDYSYLILTNTYGPGMRLDEKRTGIAEIIAKIVNAEKDGLGYVNMHGSGGATRDFLYIDDAIEGIIVSTEQKDCNVLNVGSGTEISIKSVVQLLAEICGYAGEIRWDTSREEGDSRSVLDISESRKFGFEPLVSIREGMRRTLEWYNG